MSNTQAQAPYRTRYICVSNAVYEGLRAKADVENASCPDEVADLHLALWLSNEADLRWLIDERKKRLKALHEEYTERVRAKDQLP